MALQFRYLADFAFGTLSSAISISDTTLSSAEFTSLRTLTSGTTYIPLVLLDPSSKLYEVVWLSAHNASATTGTVSRGQEGSAAQEWPSGTQWIVAPTMRDSLTTESLAALPADGHVGMRMAVGDKGDVRQQTFSQGWQGYAYSTREDLGRAEDGTTSHPNGIVPIIKAFTATGTTNGTGFVSFPIPNGGFPTRVVSAAVTKATNLFFVPTIDSGTTTKTTLGLLCQISATQVFGNTAVVIDAVVVGY